MFHQVIGRMLIYHERQCRKIQMWRIAKMESLRDELDHQIDKLNQRDKR